MADTLHTSLKQAMRPALIDCINYVNKLPEISTAADVQQLEDDLAQSISDTADKIIDALYAQPDFEQLVTNVINGVTITTSNCTRIGNICGFDINVKTNGSTSVLQGTILAQVAEWIKGTSCATAYNGYILECSESGLRCSSPLTTNSNITWHITTTYSTDEE